jgi:hypothetical protein
MRQGYKERAFFDMPTESPRKLTLLLTGIPIAESDQPCTEPGIAVFAGKLQLPV